MKTGHLYVLLTRDKVVHDYFGISHDNVWALAKEELPVLLPSLTAINPEDI
jgi:uncharacterized protein with HEPN domain